MIGTQVAHYIIREQLGKGGMGVVYRATDTKLDREVALKFLPPDMAASEDAKARFVQEAKAASALDHPNICTIYEIGESDDGKLFIAMSYYQGQTLKYLLDEGALSESKAASVAMQVADGLRTAHHAGIIHRDIKPANIILTDEGRVKILDFGLAKLGQGVDLTKAGSTVGTTSYMSPEQSSGDEVDGRTDLWSLGVIFYEMLSGKKAFGGEYDQAVLYAVLNQDPEPLTGIDEGLVGIVEDLLKKDPEERTASADALMRALDPYASGVVRIAEGPRTSASSKPARPAWAIPAGIGAVLVVLALGWWLGRPGSSSQTADTADYDEDRILVLPFAIQGPAEMDYLSESMVTILSNLFDGAGTLITVDDASVLEAMQGYNDDVIGPSIGQALSDQFGAANFILGSIIKVGSDNRITARVYSREGEPGEEALATYSTEAGFIPAIDELASGLMRGMLDNPDQDLSSLAAGTTNSFEALRHYLNAEKLIRAGDYREGLAETERALAFDSTFALAWYLRAEAWGWIDPLNGLSEEYIKQAARFGSELTGRAKRILDAETAFLNGAWRRAEAIYEGILRDYPDDLEATGQLAEVYMHYSPLEDEQLRALELFNKVGQLTPGSRQFAMHEIDLEAFKAKLTGDYHGLDSLAAVFAGMPIPERGDSLDWIRVLDQIEGGTGGFLRWHARLRTSGADSVATISRGRTGYEELRQAAYGFPVHAEASARIWGLEDRYGNWMAKMAQGRYEEGFALDLNPPQIQANALARASMLAALDDSGIPVDRLDAFVAQVNAWDIEGAPFSYLDMSNEKFRAYLNALVAFRKQDRDALRERVRGFANVAGNPEAEAMWDALENELLGLERWMDGDVNGAIQAMRGAFAEGLPILDGESLLDPLIWRIQPYRYLARLLEVNGQPEEALRYYKAVVHIPTHQATAWENAGRLHAELGQHEEALRYYSLMVGHWENADPLLQPRVEAARQEINRLLDLQAREPQ